MTMSHIDTFNIGFNFARGLRQCHDARDVGRLLTSDCFPPEVHGLASLMNGFGTLDEGTFQSMQLLRALCASVLDRPPRSLEEALEECRKWKMSDEELKRLLE